ncbi:6,7-dimethyl-8-ribityllumazine synthase [Ignicoccus hospitalis]|uniref:6,7-dimethyl-8-ribityllumazine synthase n=1 Tax=Ignicoccus hospitalis (strain KIN4/I / DSM 18386 / JCM 14125) TaxID=453591 RepID=A8AB14_IGNH4|nr:6,7-dimethyl-8-ribityllumazine synthase [Ignicoccus hospitalis]ABU82116.1 6,7-dimethyl-8-ribityllumazine synthase [Ignicoccus hospitalis KIN4/I]HIH91074.1 6,7-dimethyl-8-ribityllumazine synthase [Desulfurococcaceae archaeon]
MRLGIVVSEFNYDITRLMLEKALDHAKFLGVEEVLVLKVPGSFEAPLAAKRLLEEGCDAVAVLGAVIKGETDHDQVVAHQVARKLMDLSLEYGKPVTLGVIGPGATREQAAERIEEYARRAVEAAVKAWKRLNEGPQLA